MPDCAVVDERIQYRDAGHGYDVFGLEPTALKRAIALASVIHDRYFRVEAHGLHHVPRQGRAVLAANHSGLLPIDAAMIITNVFKHTHPPRIPRVIGDFFVPLLPIFGTLFSRVGMFAGSRANFRYLLETDELLLVFPEGTPGIGKRFSRRYQLQGWRVGHAELALRHRAPVIPVAVIGAEEAWPQLARIERFHAFGAPFLPIPAAPLPLPVKIHIHYGEPMALHERWDPDQADDPDVIDRAAELVRLEVESLIQHGLTTRKGVWS